MVMKKILPYLLCLLVLSCDKLFHEEEISIAEITTLAELEQAVNGVYAQFFGLFTDYNGLYYKFLQAYMRGDDMASLSTPVYNHYYNDENGCESYIFGDGYLDGAWNELYAIIASANNIIGQFYPPLEQGKEKKQLLGEAYFLRAYCYFRLVRTYGRIPLAKDIDIDYSTPLAGYEEIYTFIESDLKTAMQLLPRNNSEARTPFVTAHRGVAKAYLAEVYLNWAGYPAKNNTKYTLAARTAKEVIDSAEYFGFGLEEDFARVWEEGNRYNPETIFALYFITPDSTTMTNTYSNFIPGVNTGYSGYNIENTVIIMYMLEADSSMIMIWGGIPSEINFYNDYPKNYRRDITFFTTLYVPGYIVRDNPELDSGYVEVTAGPCARPGYRKFFYTSSVNILSYEYCMNTPMEERFHGNPKIYLYRYAQVLLTYAEATARSGQLSTEAYEAVNQIRRRAYNVDIHSASPYDISSGLSAEAFADSVVQERAWELAGEPDVRWFDLIRLEKVEEVFSTRHPLEGGFPEEPVTKDDYFFPIPEGEVILNPNLEE